MNLLVCWVLAALCGAAPAIATVAVTGTLSSVLRLCTGVVFIAALARLSPLPVASALGRHFTLREVLRRTRKWRWFQLAVVLAFVQLTVQGIASLVDWFAGTPVRVGPSTLWKHTFMSVMDCVEVYVSCAVWAVASGRIYGPALDDAWA